MQALVGVLRACVERCCTDLPVVVTLRITAAGYWSDVMMTAPSKPPPSTSCGSTAAEPYSGRLNAWLAASVPLRL